MRMPMTHRFGSNGGLVKVTIATVKKALATSLPDVEFTYGTAGRGRLRGPSVSWTGGPEEDEVRKASGYVWEHRNWYFVRHHTPEELDALHARWEIEAAEREAAEPARRAAAKAAGNEKRKATIAAKKAFSAALQVAFPSVAFAIDGRHIARTDGPNVATVADVMSIGTWQCTRRETPVFHAENRNLDLKVIAERRLAKRLAASKVRAIRVAKGIARRRRVHCDAQMTLPLDMPICQHRSKRLHSIERTVSWPT